MQTRRRLHRCLSYGVIVLSMAGLVSVGGHSSVAKGSGAGAQTEEAHKGGADPAEDHSDAYGDDDMHGYAHYSGESATHDGRIHGHGGNHRVDGGRADAYHDDDLLHRAADNHGVGGDVYGSPYHTDGNGGPFGTDGGGNMFGMSHDDPYADFMHVPQSIQVVAGACDPLVVDLSASE